VNDLRFCERRVAFRIAGVAGSLQESDLTTMVVSSSAKIPVRFE
jgi:hypothetical protein